MKLKPIHRLLLIAFVVKMILACVVELNNDEVYYWTYPQWLQWNYFDHPPGIAILLKLSTFFMNFQQVFFLRLGPVCCGVLSAWLVYRIGKQLRDEYTGFLAAFLFMASPYASLMAGFLVMPDSPQLVCWLASVWLMLRIIDEKTASPASQRKFLLLLGITIGCCIMSKVHGVFLWLGFGAYILFFQRRLLASPFLYFSALLSVIIASPILLWSRANNAAGYNYHSNRVHFFTRVDPSSFFREVLGEIGYNNPIIFVFIVMAVIGLLRKKTFVSRPVGFLFLFLSIPLIAVVLSIAVFNDTLPHWTGPAYTTLIPLAAVFLSWRRSEQGQNTFPRIAKYAMGLTVSLLLIALVLIKWLPFNIGSKSPQELGAGDPTLDMNGFAEAGRQIDSLCQVDFRNREMSTNSFLISDYWFPAAHIDYYCAHRFNHPFLAFGDIPAIHHYAWLNAKRDFLKEGEDAYFITVSNYFNEPSEKLTSHFEKVLPPASITQYRSGVPVRNFFVYRLKNYKGGLPRNGVWKD